jgi:hypothetical protein
MIRRSIAVAALALLVTNGAHATVLIDTITSMAGGPTNDGGSGPSSDGSVNVAASFTYSGSAPITSIVLGLGQYPSVGTGVTSAYLVPSVTVGGLPSPDLNLSDEIAALGTINDSSLPSISATSIYQNYALAVASLSAVSLADGTQYWVLLEPAAGSNIAWGLNTAPNGSDIGTTGQYAYSGVNGSGDASYPIDGSVGGNGPLELIVSTPEPATAALLGVGLGGLGFARRRAAKKA